MFYLDTHIKEYCCGCRACEHICPEQCITMFEDEEGFYYPIRDEKICINCELCKQSCPHLGRERLLQSDGVMMPQAYMAINKDRSIVEQSASGGAFSAIVKAFCKDNFVVFGVKWERDFRVVHSYTTTIDETAEFRKSKYVQSDIGDSYKKAECFLEEGKKVLFSGTPCQVAALRLYLNKDYENLFTVDVVCHGVPSQKVFNTYLSYLQHRYNGPVTFFTFRHKHCDQKNRIWNSRNVKATVNGQTIILDSSQDFYLRGYHKSLFYRPSCYQCKYANSKRISDVTIADFWGVDKLYPDKNPHEGISALIINSSKGKSLLKEMEQFIFLSAVDMNFVVENNGQLRHPTHMHPLRSTFFHKMESTTFDKAVEQCVPPTPFWRRLIARMLPPKWKIVIKRFIT